MIQNNMEWFKIWSEEIYSPHPDVARATAAAHQLLHSGPDLRLLAAAIGSTVEDHLDCDTCQAQLPDFLYAQTEPARPAAAATRRHPALKPHTRPSA